MVTIGDERTLFKITECGNLMVTKSASVLPSSCQTDSNFKLQASSSFPFERKFSEVSFFMHQGTDMGGTIPKPETIGINTTGILVCPRRGHWTASDDSGFETRAFCPLCCGNFRLHALSSILEEGQAGGSKRQFCGSLLLSNYE